MPLASWIGNSPSIGGKAGVPIAGVPLASGTCWQWITLFLSIVLIALERFLPICCLPVMVMVDAITASTTATQRNGSSRNSVNVAVVKYC